MQTNEKVREVHKSLIQPSSAQVDKIAWTNFITGTDPPWFN